MGINTELGGSFNDPKYDDERSEYQGQPIELYAFYIGHRRVQVRMTSHDQDVLVQLDKQRYSQLHDLFTAAVIDRQDVEMSSDHGADPQLQIEVDYANPLMQFLQFGIPSGGIELHLMRGQVPKPDRGDPTDYQENIVRDPLTLFTGSVVNIERAHPYAKITCQTLRGINIGTGAYSRYTRGRCRHIFNSYPACKAGIKPTQVSIEMVTTKSFKVTPSFTELAAAGYFLNGTIEFQGQARNIVAIGADQRTFNVDLPLYVGSITTEGGFVVGTPGSTYLAWLMPGCDLTFATCHGKYGNAINYGGYDDMPISAGPFAGNPVYQSGNVHPMIKPIKDVIDKKNGA